jgi:hypothetical protein
MLPNPATRNEDYISGLEQQEGIIDKMNQGGQQQLENR